MTDERYEMFSKRYQQQDIPWDTGITPPEIIQLVQEMSPGKALDLGCGTGTTMHDLLQRGWQVDGVDFVAEAITQAHQKLAHFPAENYTLHCHDVTTLPDLSELRSPYDLVIDIGCGHSLPVETAKDYVRDVASLMKASATWIVYAHQPTAERNIGWKPADVKTMFAPYFEIRWQTLSTDTSVSFPSGWYCLSRRAD